MIAGVIEAGELEALLADLVPIGLDETGATTRLAWTGEDEQAAAWFARRAEAIGRRLERDPAGNLWACPDAPPPWWAVGSHLDSVRAGGRFDGALGVAAGFAVAERLPVAVISFADEEGARFNTPTFGSRALVGRLDAGDADRARRRSRGHARRRDGGAPASIPKGWPALRPGSTGWPASSSCTSTRRATSPPRTRRPASSRGWRRGCGCRWC